MSIASEKRLQELEQLVNRMSSSILDQSMRIVDLVDKVVSLQQRVTDLERKGKPRG